MMTTAHEIGLTGWVKNLPDGPVEAMVQGNEKQIQAILEWAKKGPPLCHVHHIEETEGCGVFHEFSIQ